MLSAIDAALGQLAAWFAKGFRESRSKIDGQRRCTCRFDSIFRPKKNRPLATSATDAIARNHLSHKVLYLPWWKCLTCHLQKLQGLTLSRHSTNCTEKSEKSCTGAYQTPAQKQKISQPFVTKNMWKSAQVPCYIKGVSNKASLSSPLVERTWSCITSLTRRARQYVPPANICGSC